MIKRKLLLSKFIEKNQSLLLFGPRGSGKTKLLETTLPGHRLIISLLESEYFQRYLVDPSLFSKEIVKQIQSQPADSVLVVAVDEVQKLPILLDEVHYLIEKYKGRVVFVLTGSSARKLKRSGANLLAARALTIYLHPLSQIETELDLDTVLATGSLPGVYLDQEFAKHRLRSYIGTYLKVSGPASTSPSRPLRLLGCHSSTHRRRVQQWPERQQRQRSVPRLGGGISIIGSRLD